MTYINKADLMAQARGRWAFILQELGIPRDTLKNRHQPCPFCGGRDRYRFDDKDGNGTFICNQCGAGDGMELARRWLATDFSGSLNAVAGVLGIKGAAAPARPQTRSKAPDRPPEPQADKLAAIAAKLEQAQPVSQTTALQSIARYLAARGINSRVLDGIRKDALLLHPCLTYYHPTPNSKGYTHMGSYPAMLACITNAQGETAGLHITYLQPDCSGKLVLHHDGDTLPAKKMQSRFSGSLKGAAVRLFPHNGTLCVCEGIETALAVRELTGLPVWACLSANGLQSFAIPPDITELAIYADNDRHKQNTGEQAARRLAGRAIMQGITVKILTPKTDGNDWLDELNRIKEQLGGETWKAK